MKNTLILIFTIVTCISYGQYNDSTIAETKITIDNSASRSETILRLENPYSDRKTKWIRKNGFDIDSYKWDDPTINLYLDQALKNRSTSGGLGGIGGVAFTLNLFGNMMGRLLHDLSDDSNKGEYIIRNKGIYAIGGAMIISSIIIGKKGKSKVIQAQELRRY